ncbi:MAG: PepSY-like domain-containing protein [Phocaeicola sp.]|nr:PepSY-like domain-containing protein [Phocaeicola sp.]
MKKNLVYPLGALILGMSLSFQSCDKEDDIDLLSAPEFVQKTFSSMYPDVNYAEWELEKATKKYKADFHYFGTHSEWGVDFNNVEANAWFMSDGAWEKTEFDVTAFYRNSADTFIPAAVRTKVAELSGGREIDLDAVDTPSTDYFLLEVDYEPNDKYYKIGFDGRQID